MAFTNELSALHSSLHISGIPTSFHLQIAWSVGSSCKFQSTLIYWEKPSSIPAISGLPEVSEGDSLANLTHDILKKSGKEILDGDIFVVTQKIVSKSEGMSRNLDEHSFEDLLKKFWPFFEFSNIMLA